MIRQSDHDKRGFVRYAFDEDWLNPQLYDLLLNVDKLSFDSATKIVIDAAKSDEIKACGRDYRTIALENFPFKGKSSPLS